MAHLTPADLSAGETLIQLRGSSPQSPSNAEIPVSLGTYHGPLPDETDDEDSDEASLRWQENSFCATHIIPYIECPETTRAFVGGQNRLLESTEKLMEDLKATIKTIEERDELLTRLVGLRGTDLRAGDVGAAFELKDRLVSNCKQTVTLYEQRLTTETYLKRLAERLVEVQEECLACWSWPKEQQTKMTWIMCRMDEGYDKSLALTEELNKLGDTTDHFNSQLAALKNEAIAGNVAQLQQEPEKVVAGWKKEAEQLQRRVDKKEKVLARRRAKKEK